MSTVEGQTQARVMVPVQLDVLTLRAATPGFADCRMQAPPKPTVPAPADTDSGTLMNLLPAPFADLDAPRPPGTYLHWAVPDALTRERPETTGAATESTIGQLYPIPDRWLVSRLSSSPSGSTRSVTSWVIEASTATPTVTPLERWSESGTRAVSGRAPTVLGHGDLAWAAYYDNVVNRLAFYDPLEDSANGPLAYLVCGWYADSDADPLADPAITTLSDFQTRLADLGWALPYDSLEVDVPAVDSIARTPLAMAASQISPEIAPVITDGTWWPRSCVFHGAAVAIGWPGIGIPGAEGGVLPRGPNNAPIEAGGLPDPDTVVVAFGASSTDALAALMVADMTPKPSAPEREQELLEAMQEGALAEIDHADGRARLDARLHAAGFDARPGGTTQERVGIPGSLDPAQIPASSPSARSAREVTPAHHGAGLAAGLASAMRGGLDDLLESPGDAAAAPTGSEDVVRSAPRYFTAAEPTVAIQGGERSMKYGGDGRFTQDATLVCRLTGQTVTGMHLSRSVDPAWTTNNDQNVVVFPAGLLESRITRPGIPTECDDLLAETVLLDPGSAHSASAITIAYLNPTDDTVTRLARRLIVEQTVWWALRDPNLDPTQLVGLSALQGTLPSPLAITPPNRPWAPRHVDWEVEVVPSPGGLDAWTLGELDFDLVDVNGMASATPGAGTVIRARSLVTGKAAETAAAAGREAIRVAQLAGSGASDIANAQAVVDTLAKMDVLTCRLDRIHASLRGEAEGQYVGGAPPPATVDPGATGLVEGVMRPLRMRLVDGFGQVVNVLGPDGPRPAELVTWETSPSVAIPGRADVIALAPRFTAPARLLLRFTDADAPSGQAPTPLEQTGAEVRPVCGFVLPDHLDGSLQFFADDGTSIGSLRTAENAAIVWDDAPGRASRLGARPSELIPNRYLGALADALVARGALDAANPDQEGSLEALLRVVDSTLWTVDPFGHAGDEHLALLVGHPLVVLRARLRLDVDDPLEPDDTARAPVPVRLGALSQWQDGLMGFFLDDDYTSVRPADPAAPRFAREIGPGVGYLGPIGKVPAFHESFAADLASSGAPRTPVTHPFVADSPTFVMRPGEEIAITLIAMPQTSVHATTGLLPRKEIGMRREWIASGLARITPTFRFGPVLVDPRTIRMPVATELAGSWSWNHRTDATTWKTEPVGNATASAAAGTPPAIAEEGWLELDPPPAAP